MYFLGLVSFAEHNVFKVSHHHELDHMLFLLCFKGKHTGLRVSTAGERASFWSDGGQIAETTGLPRGAWLGTGGGAYHSEGGHGSVHRGR